MPNLLPALFTAMALVLATECIAEDDKELPIIGRWTGDASSVLLQQNNVPEEARKKLEALPEEQKPRINVIFSSDGNFVSTFSMGGRTQRASGKWELLHRSDREIRVRNVGSNQKNVAEITFQIEGPDQMTMISSDRPGSITVKRVPDQSSRPGRFEYPQLKFSLSTGDNDWTQADESTLSVLNEATSAGVSAHAQKSKTKADAATVDSAILLLCSKLPLLAEEDNPNILLAKERSWSEQFEKSGAGYFELLKDRMKVLNAPTEFSGQPRQLQVGNSTFHTWDVTNTKVASVKQKQRYFCTFREGYYIYFVLSYNEETDADFKRMMEIVESFTEFPGS